MSLVYRTARADDLERAQALIVASINDLTEQHGFGPMASARPPHFQLFSLQDDPAGLWMAEDEGRILGTAFSWASGDLWFLAELFVAPDQQGRGVGNELLKRALQHAESSGARHKALITFVFNRVSQGLYIRHGIFPRMPVYNFSVGREPLLRRLQARQPLHHRPLQLSDLPDLAQIDARAVGSAREKHHRFLIGDAATKGVMLHAGGNRLGYAYIGAGGHIGPLAVTDRNALDPAFRTALGLAADTGAPQLSAFLPGTANAALSVAVECGMRITIPMLLMSSSDFGDWACYLPRNPGFM